MVDSKVKVLLIDDRPENLHAMKMTLRPLHEAEIHTARSGNEGLALMLEHEFAVVLLDVQMPGMDGFETAALMQDHAATRNVPIIFVTAISKEEEHIYKGYQSGAVDYLFKPIDPDILLSKVKVFINLYQQRQECERMQLELQKNRNLEALGVLAGGIAHDFNNLLTTIFGYIELAQMMSTPESAIHQKLGEAVKAAKRARDLTQQLLTFAKGGRPVKESADIAQLLTDTVSLLLSGSKVKVSFAIDPHLGSVEVDKGQIGQVFQNLLFNAKEAMPEGGNLSIAATNTRVAGGAAEPLLKEGGYVRITFQDDGPGIDPANIDRIFDPYFSTKAKGAARGQGLGLTISHSIIKKHGGAIQVESTPGKGATFHVYLPAVPGGGARPMSPPPAPSAPPMAAEGHAAILVMEDEEGVAGAFGEMLKFLGYAVRVAANGPEALALFAEAQAAGHPFAAVILDLTIRGGEGGEKVLVRLREIDPTVKAIVASGYGDNAIMANYRNYGFEGMIVKPFTLQTLAAVVEGVL